MLSIEGVSNSLLRAIPARSMMTHVIKKMNRRCAKFPNTLTLSMSV